MNENTAQTCPKPKVSKILLLLFVVFALEIIYISYVKEKTDKAYELLYQLQSMQTIYQKIDSSFDKKNTHQNFDDIVKNTRDFNAILKLLRTHAHLSEMSADNPFHILYEKLQSDFKSSQEYVERYKTWSSLTTNSVRLLYDMHPNIQDLIEGQNSSFPKKAAIKLLDDITNMISMINYDGLSDAKLLRQKIHTLQALSASKTDLSKLLIQQGKHINVILEGYALIQSFKVENSALHINETIASIHQVLLNDFKHQDNINRFNIYALNAFVLLLLTFLFFTHKKEAQLHHKVCGLNQDLKDNVDTLQSVNKEMQELIKQFGNNVIASKTDLKGIITYASCAFCEISGYTKEELLEKPHNIMRHPDTPKEHFKEMWKTIQSGQEWKGEIKNRKKNGDFYWVDVTVTPEFDEQGKAIGYSAIRHDITAKKELEALSRTLEQQVQSRTKELEVMVQKVELLSITDELTQLYNRRHYTQVLANEIKRAQRRKKFFNYLLLDIDNFKPYNDIYGHQLGDAALQKVAQAFTALLNRPDDVIFRMGGEEFCVIFTSDTREQADAYAQKIIDSVAALNIEHQCNHPYNVLTVSAGLISHAHFLERVSENEVYKQADILLYQAKDEGRNRFKSS